MSKQVKQESLGVKLNVDGKVIELTKKLSSAECQRLSEKPNCSGFFEEKPEPKTKNQNGKKD